jgi:hypothetical protein
MHYGKCTVLNLEIEAAACLPAFLAIYILLIKRKGKKKKPKVSLVVEKICLLL